MNKKFSLLDDGSKVTFLDVISEEKYVIEFSFKESAHEFLKEKYPIEYKNHLLDCDKNIFLTALIEDVSEENKVVKVKKLEFCAGDDTIYDDSRYEVFKCFNHPNGIVMDLPINIIEGVYLERKYE